MRARPLRLMRSQFSPRVLLVRIQDFRLAAHFRRCRRRRAELKALLCPLSLADFQQTATGLSYNYSDHRSHTHCALKQYIARSCPVKSDSGNPRSKQKVRLEHPHGFTLWGHKSEKARRMLWARVRATLRPCHIRERRITARPGRRAPNLKA